MKIETKYEVGTHIWIIYKRGGEVQVFDDYIVNIVINEDKELIYMPTEGYEEFKEDDIILYEDLVGLANKIKELMGEIRESEK